MEELGDERRIFGLDVMRAVAVLLVLMGHFFVQSHVWGWVRSMGGWGSLGVEIFFVLSGYLIGGIIIDLIRRGRFQNFQGLYHFWMRRWLRTLPLYYLFFFLYLWFDPAGPQRLVDKLEYLVFMQSFAWMAPNFFILSWSLAIEEYFYLLFPFLLLLVTFFLKNSNRALIVSILFFLVAPMICKVLVAPQDTGEFYDLLIRIKTITRLDALMYGVGAVYIKKYHPELFLTLRRWTIVPLLMSIGVFAYYYLNLIGIEGEHRFAIQVFLLPIVSLSFAGLLPFFAEWKTGGDGWVARATVRISKISYSMYLGHIMMLGLVNQVVKDGGVLQSVIYDRFYLLYPIYLVFILLLAQFTYMYWEQPFMRLRRHFPR